jgi:hypothetical protein
MTRALVLCLTLIASPALADPGYVVIASEGGWTDSSWRPCVTETYVVGRTHCPRFAAWDVTHVPRVQLYLGASLHRFDLDRNAFAGSDQRYLVAGGGSGTGGSFAGTTSVTALTYDLRVTGLINRFLYLGAEGNAGEIDLDDEDIAGDGVYIAGGAVVGLGIPLGGVSLRAETFAGHRWLSAPTYGDRFDRDDGRHGMWMVEPRASVELWLGPWTTIGAAVGTNLLNENRDVSAALFVQGHLRAYDGRFVR